MSQSAAANEKSLGNSKRMNSISDGSKEAIVTASQKSNETKQHQVLPELVSSSDESYASDSDADAGPKLASALGVEDESKSSLRRPKMYGHRGSIYEEPENTIQSFQRAVDHGVEGVELDVFLLKCGKVAVFHGDGGDKLPGGLKGYCGVDGSILNLTANEAKELEFQGEAHVCPEEKLDDAEIPMLEEVSCFL